MPFLEFTNNNNWYTIFNIDNENIHKYMTILFIKNS